MPHSARLLALGLVSLGLAACSASPEPAEDPEGDEGALFGSSAPLAPIYLGQASLSKNAAELYAKLTVTPSVVSRGAKVTGPDLFGIVCTNEGAESTCTLNWVQRRADASPSFMVTGSVAKKIYEALPANDRTYQSEGIRFRCDLQEGGLMSSDLYHCAFSGLEPVIREVKGSVPITGRASLTEADARAAADKLFPRM